MKRTINYIRFFLILFTSILVVQCNPRSNSGVGGFSSGEVIMELPSGLFYAIFAFESERREDRASSAIVGPVLLVPAEMEGRGRIFTEREIPGVWHCTDGSILKPGYLYLYAQGGIREVGSYDGYNNIKLEGAISDKAIMYLLIDSLLREGGGGSQNEKLRESLMRIIGEVAR